MLITMAQFPASYFIHIPRYYDVSFIWHWIHGSAAGWSYVKQSSSYIWWPCQDQVWKGSQEGNPEPCWGNRWDPRWWMRADPTGTSVHVVKWSTNWLKLATVTLSYSDEMGLNLCYSWSNCWSNCTSPCEWDLLSPRGTRISSIRPWYQFPQWARAGCV